MDSENSTPRVGRWGDPLPSSAEVANNLDSVDRTLRRRLWWLLGTGVGIVVLVGVFFGVRQLVIRSLSESCRQAVRAEDWQQLETLAARWRMWDRNKAAPIIYLAEAANRTTRYERAVELLGELPPDDPMTPPALLERSDILFGPLNRAVDGAATLERAIEVDPLYAEARRRLIYFYAYTLQRKKVVDLAYDTIEHDCDLPETYVYLFLRDSLWFSNAYEENTRWFNGDRDRELFLVARAVHRIHSRGLDEGLTPAEEAESQDTLPLHQKVVAEYFEKFPHNLELLAYYLQLSTTKGDIAEVANLLSQAPPEAAEDNRFWRYMGWLHAARGEYVQAKESYEKALLLNCFDHISRHQLAGVERRFKNLEQVQMHEELVGEGKAIRRQILELQNVAQVPPGLLERMAVYAQNCGDELVATQLRHRIEQWSAEWARTAPQPQEP